MTAPLDRDDRPMAEPGKRPADGDVGGVAAAAQAGVADWAQRSTERGDDTAIGGASTGDVAGAAAGPRIDRGGKAAPGSAPGTTAHIERAASDDRATPARDSNRDTGIASAGAAVSTGPTNAEANRDDDEEEWRHPPVAPADEANPLRSLGKAVGDTVTGSGPDAPASSER
jgi:hypothetical protein